MGKSTTITHFFKRKNLNDSEATTSDATLPTTNADIPIPENIEIPIPENVDILIQENPHPKFQKIDTSLLERDPGLRQQIWDYHVNQRDEIRRAYRNYGVFQPKLSVKKNLDQKSIVVAFKRLGTISFQNGSNILLRKMQHFVFHVFYFISHLGILEKMHSRLMDLEVGRKLEMEQDVLFCLM